MNTSAAKDGKQQNCNSNNSQGNNQASSDALLKNLTNSGAHTNSNVKGNGKLADEIVPESQEQNGKEHSSKTRIDSISASESSLARNSNSNIEKQSEPDVPDGARAVDSSAPPNSQPKSHKVIRGRKKSNKEGNICIWVCVYVCCLRLNVYITMLMCFYKIIQLFEWKN